MVRESSVSVIIPCYRCAQTIGRALASVAAQTLRPAEVILVDDCSNDDTLEALCTLSDQYPTGWVKVIALDKNGGPGIARNVGWAASTKDYIAFLDADDAWHPQKIEIQYNWMVANQSVILTGHACRVMKDYEAALDNLRYLPDEAVFKSVSPWQLLLSNHFSTSTVMLRRCQPHRFAPGKRYSEDYLLWLEICLDGHLCALSEGDLAYHFKAKYGVGGLSADLWRMEKGELDIYSRLRRLGRIGLLFWGVLALLSWAKYVRRLFVLRLKMDL